MREYRRIELGDSAGPLSESETVGSALDTVLEHHLHTDADPEHGSSARQASLDELIRTGFAQRIHDGAEGADARNDQTVRSRDQIAVIGQAGVSPRQGQRLDRRVNIAGSVVQNGDRRPRGRCRRRGHSAPFVLGIPRTRGSSALAWRKARAKALYSASAMWCGSRPARTRRWTVRPAW